MKCDKCGAWSEVLETRQNKAKTIVTRRRYCANGHRFTTQEIQVKRKEPNEQREVGGQDPRPCL